ncbi:hypothetical protein [Microtetraspora malaysiensis]|uniref:Abortive infection protein-like C-terminal domain-containing protein n=1 Tax=Microtetraspora malaysiensis TaxID=161358 RepID=A0ABW6T552_9ACTN
MAGKPEALDQASWGRFKILVRLKKAVGDNDRPLIDRPLIVGSAKELVEATARVFFQVRGHPAGSGEDYNKVLTAAQRAIEHQPGPGIAVDSADRQAAESARKVAGLLRELRNTYGTGHGRSTLQPVEDEVLETCVDGALLWTRWVLRRLQFLLVGALQPLINDLRIGTFIPDDQRALGVAVGQRAASNTFTVRIDGVEACAMSQDDAIWPLAYREGVVEGLFIDQFGQLNVDESVYGVRLAAEVLLPHLRLHGVLLREENARQVWSEIADYLESMSTAYVFAQENGS